MRPVSSPPSLPGLRIGFVQRTIKKHIDTGAHHASVGIADKTYTEKVNEDLTITPHRRSSIETYYCNE